MLGSRVYLTLIGIAALVVYVSAPVWLPNEVVKQLDFVALWTRSFCSSTMISCVLGGV